MPTSTLDLAKSVLKKTRDALCLGSSNISKTFYDHSSDKPIPIFGLFSSNDTQKRLSIDALIDGSVVNLSWRRVGELRGMLGKPGSKLPNFTVHSDTKGALIKQAGHCHELSLCALAILRHEGYLGKAELVQFKYAEHEFVVLNRPESSLLANFKTWGKDTVIIDPWINEVCRGDEFEKLWEEKIRMFIAEMVGKPADLDDLRRWRNAPKECLLKETLLEVDLVEANPFAEDLPDINPRDVFKR